jgi:hypothetical protein
VCGRAVGPAAQTFEWFDRRLNRHFQLICGRFDLNINRPRRTPDFPGTGNDRRDPDNTATSDRSQHNTTGMRPGCALPVDRATIGAAAPSTPPARRRSAPRRETTNRRVSSSNFDPSIGMPSIHEPRQRWVSGNVVERYRVLAGTVVPSYVAVVALENGASYRIPAFWMNSVYRGNRCRHRTKRCGRRSAATTSKDFPSSNN